MRAQRLFVPFVLSAAASIAQTMPTGTLPAGVDAGYVLRLRNLPPALQQHAAGLIYDVDAHGRVVCIIDNLILPLPLKGETAAPKPLRVGSREPIRSAAFMRDGAFLAIGGRTLAALDGGRFVSIAELPERGMNVAAAASGEAYLYGGESAAQQKRIYLFRNDRKLLLLAQSEFPVTAVAGSGETTFFAANGWIFQLRAGESVIPLFHADADVTGIALAPPSGLFFATAGGLFYLFDAAKAYRVIRGPATPVVRNGSLFVYLRDAGDLLACRPLDAFAASAQALAKPSRTPERAEPVALPDAAREAFQRADEAVAARDWRKAITLLTAAQNDAPSTPPVLFNLGQAHARAGNELAAIAWLHAYLAVRPNAPDATAVRASIEDLRGIAERKVTRITAQGQEIHEALERGGIRPGTIREYVQLSVQTAMQRGEVATAETAMQAVEDVTDRDQVWADVALRLSEWREDIDVAREAAAKIGQQAQRDAALAKIAERAGNAQDTTRTPAGDWIDLARFLSARTETAALGDALKSAAALPVNKVSIALLQVATDYGCDYLRIRKLEER